MCATPLIKGAHGSHRPTAPRTAPGRPEQNGASSSNGAAAAAAVPLRHTTNGAGPAARVPLSEKQVRWNWLICDLLTQRCSSIPNKRLCEPALPCQLISYCFARADTNLCGV